MESKENKSGEIADIEVLNVDRNDDSDGGIQLKGDGDEQKSDEEIKEKFTDKNVLDTVKREIAEEDQKKKDTG